MIDSTNPTDAKMSGNLTRLIKLNKWQDTYRILHPNETKYSHFYNSDRSGKAHTLGASRLDRSYVWGGISVNRAEYTSASFSDHLLHTIDPTSLDMRLVRIFYAVVNIQLSPLSPP